MKNVLVAMLLSVPLAGIVGAEPGKASKTGVFPHGEVTDGLAAFLTCHGNRFRADEPIPLSYGVIFVGPTVDRGSRDTSELKARVWWLQNTPELSGNYSWFEVAGPDGQNVPYHGGTGDLPDSAPLDEFSVCLHNGQFVGTTYLDLWRTFNLTKSGTYKVRWGYKPWFKGGPWTGKLMSNEVQFEIVRDGPAEALHQMPSRARSRRDRPWKRKRSEAT